MERELIGDELTFTALLMLLGRENKDWCYYRNGPKWWAYRLYMGIN